MTERKQLGRPTGRTYEHGRNIRLMKADVDDLEALARHWRCTEAEAIRRAIRETAKREKVSG